MLSVPIDYFIYMKESDFKTFVRYLYLSIFYSA